MRSFWVRAGLGALAVFALGMLLYTAAGRTRARAKQSLLEFKSELDSGAVLAGDMEQGVHVNAAGDSGELVNISADSNGAFIHVNDGKGKVVRVRADKNGLVVKVDSNAVR